MTREIKLQNFLREGVVEAGCDEVGRGPLAGPVFAAAVILPPDFHHPLLNDSKQMRGAAREELRSVIESSAVAWAVSAVSAAEIDRINILNASIAAMQRAVMALGTVPQHLLIDGNRFRPFSYIQNLAAYGSPELFSSVAGSSELSSEMKVGSPESSSPDSEIVPKNGTSVNIDMGVNSPEGVKINFENRDEVGKVGLVSESGVDTDLRAAWEKYNAIPYTCMVKGDAKFAAIAAASILAKTHRDEYMRRIAIDYPEYGWERNMGYPTPEHIAAIRLHGLTPHHRLSFKLKNL